MSFHGIFIGIDRYESSEIDRLSCARRDAIALHALFTDTLGGDTHLLTDEKATRSAIQAEFSRLASCDKDDVVVVTFSGHGSETHELVTYDADVYDLANTCIPLEELTAWFSQIPARHLLLVLDCCFSGGVGARVLRVENRSRSLPSVAAKLDRMSGDGRLILTASSATEEAWENSTYGHGFLTYYFLQALQGVEEVRQGTGQLSVYRLLEYVTRRVIDAAAQIGQPQHPALRGAIDGEIIWPVFTPGQNYHAAFPERGTTPVTADLPSLSSYGFPQELIAAWGQDIRALNQLQIDAINEYGVLRGEHIVVSAPTSSGKTMIGELAALQGVLDRKRALFLLPLKALVNDKHRQFLRVYGPYGVRTIRATGESSDDIPLLLSGQYDICLMTYEKFSALALGSPHLLNQVGTVIVDEVQMIADRSRGVNLEFILTLLRMRRRVGIEPQVIALSAVIGDTNGLEGWLSGRLLRRTERPVPLDEGLLRGDGSFRYIRTEDGQENVTSPFIRSEYRKGSSQDYIIPLVRRLVAEGKQVIVFRETRGDARGCAGYLSSTLGLPPATRALNALPSGDPSLASRTLHEALAGGVAFHISDLDRDERRVVEEEFRATDSQIRVIAATTTLAMGVNTPAEAVVVAGLTHPGNEPYSVAEYKNIVGRAGRMGYAERGESYLLALTPREEHDFWPRYVLATPEDLHSQFLTGSTDPRSLVLRVLSAVRKFNGEGMSEQEIADFLEASFGAYQHSAAMSGWAWDREQIAGAIAQLATHQLIQPGAGDTFHLTELGRLAGESGIEVESIIRLVDMLQASHPDDLSDPTLIAAAQCTVELDALTFPLNKKSTEKEPQEWLRQLERQGVAASVRRGIRSRVVDIHQPTLRAKKAVACLLWMSDFSMERIEDTLTQFGGRFNGAAGPMRGVAARTYDLLPIVIRIAEILHPSLNFVERRVRLLARLEVGVPAPLSDLATRIGLRLARGEYHTLLRAGLASIDSVEMATDESLLACVGNDQDKLAMIRSAVIAHRKDQEKAARLDDELPLYEA